MSVDKVDNQTIECMVCASCTFKGEKRQEEWEIGGDSGEAESCLLYTSLPLMVRNRQPLQVKAAFRQDVYKRQVLQPGTDRYR